MELSSATARGNPTYARWSGGLAWARNPHAPARVPHAAGANAAKGAASCPFKTVWLVSTFVVIAAVAVVVFYRKARDQSSGSQISSSPQQSASVFASAIRSVFASATGSVFASATGRGLNNPQDSARSRSPT